MVLVGDAKWEIETTFRFARPRLPLRLIGRDAFSAASRRAYSLPEGSSAYFLEFRMAPGDERVDFGVRYRSGDLDDYVRLGWMQEDWHRQWALAGCEGVGTVMAAWRRPGSALRAFVPHLWLEMDEARLDGRTFPGFLFCVDTGMLQRRDRARKRALGYVELLGIAQEAARAITGSPLPAVTATALRKCAEALPPGGRIHHISAMPSRIPAAWKVNVSLPNGCLPAYLDRIGWPGSKPRLDDVCGGYEEFVRSVKIDVGISEGVSASLGYELTPFNSSPFGMIAAGLRLAREGVADTAKGKAFSTWTGQYRGKEGVTGMPIKLDRVSGLKISLGEAGPVSKGYLGFYPVFSLK